MKRGLKTDLQTLPLLYTCEIPEDKGFIYFSSEFEQVLRALGFKNQNRPLMALKGTAKIRNMTPVVKGVEKGRISLQKVC